MNRNLKKAAVLAGILGFAALGGTVAYLTDYDQAVNEFTVGKVDIELLEPEWDPEDHTDIEPGRDIPKDPQISNTGVNEAFVYLEISVPMADVAAADQDGSRLDKKIQELFSFRPGEEWTNLSVTESGSSRVYVYAYNGILKPGETTEPLFESIQFLNIIEGQLDGQTLNVPVRAYGIQTAYTGGDGDTVQEQAKSAYEKYVNQNADQEGRVTV